MTRRADETTSMTRAERALKMTDELHRRCEEIRKRLADVGRKDMQARHQLGVLVNEIQNDPDKYGRRGVKQLAAAIGYDEKTLYKYGQVASCWSAEQIEELSQQKGTTGLPISFSHLLLIATVEKKRRRDALVQAVLNKGLSVRDLKRQLEGQPSPDEAAGEGPVKSAATALRGLRATSENWLEKARRWEAEFLPALEQEPLTEDARRGLSETLAQQQELVERLRQVMERLRGVLEMPPAVPAAEEPQQARTDGARSPAGEEQASVHP